MERIEYGGENGSVGMKIGVRVIKTAFTTLYSVD